MKRPRRWADALLSWTPGLLAVGCLYGLPWPEPERPPETVGLPPSGHPECPAGHIPPTEAERQIWAGLDLRA
ncbi:DUF6059 family protein [Streptomyces sp. NPDC046909]|uniref:DUF6059 family protein n=1 Tax=Streptomyces sp. NPDC046909 TaxID=3155617 RepID=UPI0033DFE56B